MACSVEWTLDKWCEILAAQRVDVVKVICQKFNLLLSSGYASQEIKRQNFHLRELNLEVFVSFLQVSAQIIDILNDGKIYLRILLLIELICDLEGDYLHEKLFQKLN